MNRNYIYKSLAIFFIFSCGGSEYEKEPEPTVFEVEHSGGFLVGSGISVWSHQNETEAQKTGNDGLSEVHSFGEDVNIKVTVLGIKDGNEIINPIYDKGNFTKIKFLYENEAYAGWVDSKYIFADPKGKILFGVFNKRDKRILIDPPYYSTSDLIDPNQYHGEDISKNLSYCEIFDSTLVINAARNEERGEFETREEFMDRVALLEKIANSTKWNKKIYTSSKLISGGSMSYDLDSEELTISLMNGRRNYPNQEIVARYGAWNEAANSWDYNWTNDADDAPLEYISIRGNDIPKCDVTLGWGSNIEDRYYKGIYNFRLTPSKKSYGNFNIRILEPDSSFSASDRDDIKMDIVLDLDREKARMLKESPDKLILIYGFNPSESIHAHQGQSCRSVDNYDGRPPKLVCNNIGGFSFRATLEYIFLMNSNGDIIDGYFSEEYLSKYIKNDIYIQEHIFRNKEHSSRFTSLTDTEKLAKYISLQYCRGKEWSYEDYTQFGRRDSLICTED